MAATEAAMATAIMRRDIRRVSASATVVINRHLATVSPTEAHRIMAAARDMATAMDIADTPTIAVMATAMVTATGKL